MKQILVKFYGDPQFSILIKKKYSGYLCVNGFGVIDTRYSKVSKSDIIMSIRSGRLVCIELSTKNRYSYVY